MMLIGIDPHKSTHTATAVDSLGRCGCQGRVLGGVDGGVWWGDRVGGKGCLVSGCVP